MENRTARLILERLNDHCKIDYCELNESEVLTIIVEAVIEDEETMKEEDGMEKCKQCGEWVKNEKIYSTHEDNEHPDNKEMCEECFNK